jgi:hypothetical protein
VELFEAVGGDGLFLEVSSGVGAALSAVLAAAFF